MKKTRIWDLPTRLFHWALVLCVIGLVVTGKISGMALDVHAVLGYSVLCLVLFRLLWGVVGGRWSRFAQFVPTPARLRAYVSGRYASPAGHNPLGALSVLAMLAVLALQVASGLVINNEDNGFTGPLYAAAPGWLSDLAGQYHKDVGQVLLLILVGLHLLAIHWHAHRHNPKIVHAMLTGDQEVTDDVTPSNDHFAKRLLALVLWSICVAGVFWLVAPRT
ncbi:MAG: cytochrome b/b6 domain-containing protein [Alphaproteobacteria bacterium]|nr:cytochrome b/b6 domain-containing protein [Alphaproteobacteria bacterium]